MKKNSNFFLFGFVLLAFLAQPLYGRSEHGFLVDANRSAQAIRSLDAWLRQEQRPPLEEQPFAETPLTIANASVAKQRLWQDYVGREAPTLRREWDSKVVRNGDHEMKFMYRTIGDKPEQGWDLHLAFHGGGGAPSSLNDSQWQNHLRLYNPANSIYVVPRAPADTWDLWHLAQVDGLLARIIEGAVLIKGANPDRVFISGYSAGGDGVYQLAPRLADRLAAAAAMAGHPNETEPLGLRNIGFTVHMGANDAAYNRNKVALEWKRKLAELQADDPGGYRHEVVIHEGLGHWVMGRDAVAMEWMAEFTRNPLPQKIAWRQDDVTHSQFYWLEVPEDSQRPYSEIVAEIKGQTILLGNAKDLDQIGILLNDEMLDLDKKVKVVFKGQTLFDGYATRTLATIARTLERKKDPKLCFSAQIVVNLGTL